MVAMILVGLAVFIVAIGLIWMWFDERNWLGEMASLDESFDRIEAMVERLKRRAGVSLADFLRYRQDPS